MKTIKISILIFLLLIGMGVNKIQANVTPAKIFSSNMVLQKGIENSVWGWANPGEAISLSINGKTIKIKATKEGKWLTKLPAMDYGGPYTLTIKGKNTIEMTNVMVGEVWICSGQSNMQWSVVDSNNAKEEIASANNPNIRLFTVPRNIEQCPVDDIKEGEWSVCSPSTIPGFTAVGYFFGRNLHQELHVAIGLINTSWGGTVAETWISPETIKNDPDFAAKLGELEHGDPIGDYNKKQEKIRELLGGELSEDDQKIMTPEYDDSQWKAIFVPEYWEKQGYDDVNGIAFYRCLVNLTEEQCKSNAELHLGKVDDWDITWFNGAEIGKTEGPSSKDRVYPVEAKLLKPGKNVITVQVFDKGGKGGIWGKPEELYLMAGNQKIPLSGNWKIKFAKTSQDFVFLPNLYPTMLYNSMIHPIVPYGIRGAIWYQGESNADRAKQYQRLFPELITDWRNLWKEGDFPFIWVQLANFMKASEQPSESEWAELREAQTMTLKLPNTGMASAIDIGNADDIHPKNKQEVGRRLALNALKITYGKDIVSQGPLYSNVEFKNGKALVSFTQTGSGLEIKDRYGYLKGFAIAGADGKFYWAKAQIVSNNQVEVFSNEVSAPKAVRYGWANNPDDVNLYNKEGLPANPFRTNIEK